MHPHANGGANRAQQAAQALASVLSNPYQCSSHYAQAHHSPQASANLPSRTPEGYSYSSAYVSSLPTQSRRPPSGRPSLRDAYQQSRGGGHSTRNQRSQHQQTHWYEPGDNRCTDEQCTFTGSKRSVEIHMMDRHLIYPAGWDKRKRKRDWDADPSLNNGKPIPIQGTTVILDTPEQIDVWIAERRKRWPTASRVQEKELKLKAAMERGEIAASDLGLRGRKRLRAVDLSLDRGPIGGGHDRDGAQTPRIVHPLPMKPVLKNPVKVEESDEDTSNSGSDMDPEKDAISSKPPSRVINAVLEEETVPVMKGEDKVLKDASPQSLKPLSRKPAAQPRPPNNQQRKAFVTCSSLLRNLLLPEIRMTVSNLSQAIHFLAENDFLRDVELNPGDADNKPIEVISESSHETV